MPICPNCGNKTADNAIFCDQCGTKLPVEGQAPAEAPSVQAAVAIEQPQGGVPEGVTICAACGAENVPGEVFCDVCGEPLEPPEPVAAEAIPAVETVEPETAAEEEFVEVEPVVDEVVEVEPIIEEVFEVEPIVEEEILEGEAVSGGELGETEGIAESAAVEAEVPAGSTEPDELYCPACGAAIGEGDTFCGTCGAVLAAETVEETVSYEELVTEEPEVVEAAQTEEPLEVAAEGLDEEALLEEVVVEETLIVEPDEEVIVEGAVTETATVEAEPSEERCEVCGATIVAGQAFCASCGAALQPVEPEGALVAGPYLEVVDSGAHIPLVDQPELLIGREDEISGILPDVDMTPHGGDEGGVSRRHARLVHEGDTWFVIDLDSTNGTYLNGAEIQPKTRNELKDGDTLGMGDLEVVFHTG